MVDCDDDLSAVRCWRTSDLWQLQEVYDLYGCRQDDHHRQPRFVELFKLKLSDPPAGHKSVVNEWLQHNYQTLKLLNQSLVYRQR